MAVRYLKYVALIANDKIKSMTTPTSLQTSLFVRQPHLQWILDENNNIIEPLLHQLSLNALSQQMYSKNNGIDVREILLLAIEKKGQPFWITNDVQLVVPDCNPTAWGPN